MARASRIRRTATWLALASSLGVGLTFVVLRASTPSDGARVAFYGDDWSAEGVTISPIDAPAPGLAAGDMVRAVGGRTLEAWLAVVADPTVQRPSPEGPIGYRIDRDDARLAVDVAWTAPSIGATLADGWSVVAFSIAVAAVAAFVFARRPDEPAATALIIAACGAAGSSVPWFVGVTVSDMVVGPPFLLHALVTGPLYMVLWPACLHLALVFPTRPPVVADRRWLVPSVYALGLGAYALALAVGRLVSPTLLEWVGTWPLAQVAIVVPFLGLALTLVVRSYLRTTDRNARTRIRWAVLGFAASATLGLLLFMVPELLLHDPLVPASWIGLIAIPVPLGLAAGILRHRLFEIDVVLNRTIVYGGLTLGVLACYATVASGLGALVGTDRGFAASLLATGVAALVALPLRDALQRAVNRLMYGQRDEPWQAIRRLGQRLEWAADPDSAFPAIVDTVAETLRLPYVALEVSDAEGAATLVAEHGPAQPATVALRLTHGGEPVGRLVLGVRAGEQGFRADELGLLEDLARQAGAAIHALRLRTDLARSRERLVLAREEERRRLRRDLHDGLGPSLAAIGLRAEAAAATLATDPAAAHRQLDALTADVRVALADIRRVVDGLRPPALDELGLLGAIDQQVSRLENRGDGVSVTFTVEGRPAPLPELPAAVEVAAYRIVVEAMTNVVRHSAARSCRVRLETASRRATQSKHVDDGANSAGASRAGRAPTADAARAEAAQEAAGADLVSAALTIEVVDDGRGLPSDIVPGTGLESMVARAEELGGTLRVERRRTGGTRVVARLPLGGALAP